MRPKAKMILKRISDNPDILNCNKQGELKYKGEVVPNTNTGDLIRNSDCVQVLRSQDYLTKKKHWISVLRPDFFPK